MFGFYLKDLPPFGKLFVGLVTSLMLCVCLWSVIIFYVDKGLVDESAQPLYMQKHSDDANNLSQEKPSPPAQENIQNSKPPYYEHLRKNVGLAHTHINGQTLLFFVLGVIFLFTSVKPKIKNICLWVFGLAVLTHTIGLTGEGFHWFFDDILAVSGVSLLVVIPYICFLIFFDLIKKSMRNAK